MSRFFLPARQLLAGALGCRLEELTADARLYDTPGWDSLGHAAVISALENNYTLNIENPFSERYISLHGIESLYQSLWSTAQSLPSLQLTTVTVITRDRPWTLRRCLESIASDTFLPQHLLVLDESTGEELASNERIASYLHTRLASRCAVTHIAINHLVQSLSAILPEDARSWLIKPSSRDISVNRTLSLVFSLLFDPNSVGIHLLVDDDVDNLRISEFMSLLQTDAIPQSNRIWGGIIDGIDEYDTLTRLDRFLHNWMLFCTSGIESSFDDATLVWKTTPNLLEPQVQRFVSGGFLAHSLDVAHLLPFPPGYNEDWFWCLRMAELGVVIHQMPHRVLHRPVDFKHLAPTELQREMAGMFQLELIQANHLFPSSNDVIRWLNRTAQFNADRIQQCDRLPHEGQEALVRVFGDSLLLELRESIISTATTDQWIRHACDWERDRRRKEDSFSRFLHWFSKEVNSSKFLSIMKHKVGHAPKPQARVGKHRIWGSGITVQHGVVMGGDVTLGHCTYVGHRNNDVPTSISIGEGTSIGAFCVIKNNVTIGRRVQIDDYVAIEEGAVIGDDTRILYRAHIHEGAIVGRRCVIGSDVIDRCLIEDDVTFMGDMVHAHRDPRQDWDTTEEPSPTILRGTVVGLRALLIGPVSIGPGSYIGAGEIVKASVPSNYAVLSGQTIPLSSCPFVKSRLDSQKQEPRHGNPG